MQRNRPKRRSDSLPIGVIVEPAYFCIKAIGNQRVTGVNSRDLHRTLTERSLTNITFMQQSAEQISTKKGTDANELHEDILFYADTWTKRLLQRLERTQESPNSKMSVGEIARATIWDSLYPTVPLGFLANLALTVRSPLAPAITGRLRQESNFLTRQLQPVWMPPRKPVQVQTGALLLSALSLQNR